MSWMQIKASFIYLDSSVEWKENSTVKDRGEDRQHGGETENKTQRRKDRVQIGAGVQLQKAESNQLAHRQREAWHSSPTKGDSTINSINPISIPSSSPRWVNTHLHHTTKGLPPSSICKESGEQQRVRMAG